MYACYGPLLNVIVVISLSIRINHEQLRSVVLYVLMNKNSRRMNRAELKTLNRNVLLLCVVDC